MVFLSLMGGAAFGTLQFVALQYTTALNMGVVGSVSPAFIVAASYLLFRDGLGPLQLFGVAMSLVGVLAIITQLYPERLLDADVQRRRSHHHRQHGVLGDLLRVPALAAGRAHHELPVRARPNLRHRQRCPLPHWSMRPATICRPTR